MVMSKLVASQIGILVIIVVSFVTCSFMVTQGLSMEGFMGFFAIIMFVPKLPRVILNHNQLIDTPYRPLNRYEEGLRKLALGFLLLLVAKTNVNEPAFSSRMAFF